MNTLVVYFSKFGNTQKMAETIAAQCESKGPARAIYLDALTTKDLLDADLVIMGCPTHRMNLPEAVREKFETLPKRLIKGTPVAVFDTSYQMNGFLRQFTAAKKLAQKMRKLGGKRVIPPETFCVVGKEGPLVEGEIERAQEWANTILQKI